MAVERKRIDFKVVNFAGVSLYHIRLVALAGSYWQQPYTSSTPGNS
jgi:hypothetical protein